MGAQPVDGVEGPRQLCLGQRRVDLFVTNMVQQHCRAAAPALQLGYKVVLALRHVYGDRPVAQRAKGRIVLHGAEDGSGCVGGKSRLAGSRRRG